MYQYILDKIQVNEYSYDDPLVKKYAADLYQVSLSGDLKLFSHILPASFEDLLNILRDGTLNNLVFSGRVDMGYYNSISTVSQVFEAYDDAKSFILKNRDYYPLFIKLFVLQKIIFLVALSMQNKKMTYLENDIVGFLDKKIQFSQASIAKEWDIDNDTLSKWFVIQYGNNIYAGRKKIKFSEYLGIFRDFFILDTHKSVANPEKELGCDDLDFYNLLAIKGKTYTKKDILEECFNPENELSPRDYEQAKIILGKKFPFYANLNKFPASLAFRLIAELKRHC